MSTQILKNKKVRWIFGFAGALALFDTLAIWGESARSQVAASYSFLSFLFCIFSAVIYEKISVEAETEDAFGKLVSGVIGLLFSLALTIGSRLETVENFNITEAKAWLVIIILTVYFTPLISYGWKKIEQWNDEKAKMIAQKEGGKSHFVRNWCLIFLCWLPVFLAFYPGAFVYDAQDEYVQVATRNFTTHHPLSHVLLLGGMVCAGNKFLGSYNLGIACYTLFQMVILSGVFSYATEYVKGKWNWKHAEKVCILFYGCFPVISMYAVCSAKDGLFTAAFLVVIIKMLQFFDNPIEFGKKWQNWFASILAAVVMMLFRNNGMYAYVVWIPIVAVGAFMLYKKLLPVKKNNVTDMQEIGKRHAVGLIGSMAASVVIFLLCSKVLVAILGASDSESQEIMTVPIQQMVRTFVYSPETYTEEEKQILFELIPEEDMKLYNPRLSDLVKSKFNNHNFNEDKLKYLGLWVKIGLRKPLIYLNAWWMTSYGYWYPDAVINVYGGNTVHTFTYKDSSYFGFETESPGVRESKFPWLEEQFRKLSLELYQHKIPGISMAFSPGFMFWVFLFCMGHFFRTGKWEKLFPYAGILLLWLTAVLGPTYLVRYVLILWFALPIIVSEIKL